MIRNSLSRGALLMAAMLLAACAQSPQRITVQPTLTIAGQPKGDGRAVVVSASDQRADKVLGSLGGVYSHTATLTIANNLEEALTRAANGLLATQGYVVNSSDPDAVHFHIVIKKLTYKKLDVPVGSDVKLTATLQAEVTRGGETYTGTYSTESEHRGALSPSRADNQTYVNELLSDTLKRMFSDNRLLAFLRK